MNTFNKQVAPIDGVRSVLAYPVAFLDRWGCDLRLSEFERSRPGQGATVQPLGGTASPRLWCVE